MSSEIMRWFDASHLPAHIREVSEHVHELADFMDNALPANAEKAAGLRKLLEAKDCFVRAWVQGVSQ